jgi:NADPH-dependent glutamate synthase beta subunit-like oxidoreductase
MQKGFTIGQAIEEASRCLLCHDAPCSNGCPATTEPDKFIRKLRFKNIKGAVAAIKENNILGGTCAVVCPTCSLCQQGCSASGILRPIDIGGIQRALVEYGWDTKFNPIRTKVSNGKKVAIVGAGPSGLSCAAELAKEGFSVVVFEKKDKPGGMLQYAIPEHRLSKEYVDREIEDITSLGVEIRCNQPIATQADLDDLFGQGFEAAYLATGAWECVALDVARQESEQVTDAMSFLQLVKINGADAAGKVGGLKVAVIGGGDTAIDAAITAKNAGAKSVSIIYRRAYGQMPAHPDELQAALQAGVNIVTLCQPIEYLFTQGKLSGLKVVRNELGEPDSSGRPRPVPIEGSQHDIATDVIIEAIGLNPSKKIRELSSLEFDTQNRIVVSEQNQATDAKNVFAGGDAVRGASIVAHAVGDGKKAAFKICEMLGA